MVRKNELFKFLFNGSQCFQGVHFTPESISIFIPRSIPELLDWWSSYWKENTIELEFSSLMTWIGDVQVERKKVKHVN